MYCPRLDHFVRLNVDGSVGKCGHMINQKGFESFKQLDDSEWLADVRQQMANDQWPEECKRCRISEDIGKESIRTKSIERHKILHPLRSNYLVVGGVLDNVCNSACQTCYSGLSTKIGSLEGKDYPRIDNYVRFWELPQDRILEVDVNGGEPTASRNYKKILANLPSNTRIVRMNTNGSRMIKELEAILHKRIMVIVTLSFDGVGDVHDYVRWPIKWNNFVETVGKYMDLQKRFPLLKLNCWTTVSSLNVGNLPAILDFMTENNLDHDWALIDNPQVLKIQHKNRFTDEAKTKLQNSSYALCKEISKQVATGDDNSAMLDKFIARQDSLRGIDIKDYLSF